MAEDKQSEAEFFDTLFRQKSKKGEYRVVGAPHLEVPVADTHTHLQLLANPGFALARCAANGVRFVCTIVDAYEDGATTFDSLRTWVFEGARDVRRLVRVC